MTIKENSTGIKIEGYRGKWAVIRKDIVKDMNETQRTIYTLEHEFYGEDANPLFVNCYGKEYKEFEGYVFMEDIIEDYKDNEFEERA